MVLGSFITAIKIVYEAVIFLVDVVHDGIFPRAGKRGVEVPVDGRSGIPLHEFRGYLSLTRKAEPRAKEAVVRPRVELGTTEMSVKQYLLLKMLWSISLCNWPPGDS
ncbi:unnamed protein product [Heligmosomoides polygyrus]|uniref:Uncharacterized protein n=1 Tax=Heligmosomoides polygyrus TaxID=6339 RepID=A0A183G1X2_HELPZ|nr:unnamed protein product [Heligmosomoides polygyrus]